MSRQGRSGALPNLPAVSHRNAPPAVDHDANQFFNNSDDDDEEEGNTSNKHRSGHVTANNKNRAGGGSGGTNTLAKLKRNLGTEDNDASEVISESGSVASEDIDGMEISTGGGGGGAQSDDSDGGF